MGFYSKMQGIVLSYILYCFYIMIFTRQHSYKLVLKKVSYNRNDPDNKHCTKSKEICIWLIISLFFVTMLLGNKYHTVGKLVYFPLNGATFVRKMNVATMKNFPNLPSKPFFGVVFLIG